MALSKEAPEFDVDDEVLLMEPGIVLDELTEEEITYYIERFQPFDKAGAYGIQEWIGLCKISKIEGTYANVMGLPTDLLYKHLLQL